MDLPAANASRFEFAIAGLERELKVLRLAGHEALSRPFLFQLDLAAEDESIDFAQVIDRPATLTLIGQDGRRHINGIVHAFSQGEPGQRFCLYQAELVPTLWRLTHRHTCRIFQQRSAPEIITQVLTEAGLGGDRARQVLHGTHPSREYCVQYRESDLDFISRLMEEEGIYYYFEHAENTHVLVMTDHASVHPPVTGSGVLPYQPRNAGRVTNEHLFGFHYRERLRPGTATLRDYNFKRPAQDLEGRQQGDSAAGLEVYDYPGSYETAAFGETLARIRLQELRTPAQTAAGESTCHNLLPGQFFTLTGHLRYTLNQRYLLTEVRTTGAQPQALEETAAGGGSEFSNVFECIPWRVPYRPPRVTPRPRVQGSQTAIVVGPAGEEIYTDEHGRVKVQFHWDRAGRRDEHSSCWIRVSQAWAGPAWGSMVIPRIGQEVIVDFLEGDPDRPIITGRVYHGTNRAPYALPANKTQSTLKSNSSKGGGGSNELRFEDAKGAEQLYIHAQKNQDNVVEHDETTKVGQDRTESVGRNEKIHIGANRTEDVGANEAIKIGANQTILIGQNQSETVAIAKALSVGAGYAVSVGAAMITTVGLSQTEQVGRSKTVLVGKTFAIEAGDELKITVGQASLVMKSDGTVIINGTRFTFEASGPVQLSGKDVDIN